MQLADIIIGTKQNCWIPGFVSWHWFLFICFLSQQESPNHWMPIHLEPGDTSWWHTAGDSSFCSRDLPRITAQCPSLKSILKGGWDVLVALAREALLGEAEMSREQLQRAPAQQHSIPASSQSSSSPGDLLGCSTDLPLMQMPWKLECRAPHPTAFPFPWEKVSVFWPSSFIILVHHDNNCARGHKSTTITTPTTPAPLWELLLSPWKDPAKLSAH